MVPGRGHEYAALNLYQVGPKQRRRSITKLHPPLKFMKLQRLIVEAVQVARIFLTVGRRSAAYRGDMTTAFHQGERRDFGWSVWR
jgi:hypothetical protein